jgi:exodeoxyribonuclease V alpha subunit
LESVRAGDVLGSLVRFAQSNPVLGQCWVELTESQRFKHRPAIGALASAIVASDPDAALKLLRRARQETNAITPDAGLVYLGDTPFAYPALPPPVREAVEAVAFADTPEAALAALDRVRFLAAHREHSFGVAGLNASIQRHIEQLAAERGASTLPLHPPALPIVVNRNDPETALSNGSVGVIMTVNGARAAYFPAATAGAPPRRIGVSQLPDHSPAWAMTIHRSQGSEFDHVVVFLPGDESPLATRELLYTATTRAKDHVYLSGPEATVRAALSNRTLRCTLIERALSAPPTLQPPR